MMESTSSGQTCDWSAGNETAHTHTQTHEIKLMSDNHIEWLTLVREINRRRTDSCIYVKLLLWVKMVGDG